MPKIFALTKSFLIISGIILNGIFITKTHILRYTYAPVVMIHQNDTRQLRQQGTVHFLRVFQKGQTQISPLMLTKQTISEGFRPFMYNGSHTILRDTDFLVMIAVADMISRLFYCVY